ncbi:MAG: PD-(D/E)XK nuclease family protein [archaeon]
MVEVYSNSKLWLYENCPEAYKIKYIDKTFPDLPKSIHAFLGSAVHEALEHLYGELMGGKVLDLDQVIEYFARGWHDKYALDIRVPVGEKVDYFFNRGVKFLIDYYQSNLPFSKKTIDIERKIYFPIDKGVFILGYIDRIEKHKDGSYEVHDYKTNNAIKKQEEVDADRQLAFYHMGLQNLFGPDITVKLTWHFLAHNKKIHSFRTPEQLAGLKAETLALIERIRNTKEWPACGKPFCDWCSYRALHGITSKSDGASGGGEVRRVFTLNDSLGKWL